MESSRCLETEPCTVMINKKSKDWPKLLRIKTIYFTALSHVCVCVFQCWVQGLHYHFAEVLIHFLNDPFTISISITCSK